jgi:hypothetical protein
MFILKLFPIFASIVALLTAQIELTGKPLVQSENPLHGLPNRDPSATLRLPGFLLHRCCLVV